MHKLQYAEISNDDQKEARERERMALDQSIELMLLADGEGAVSTDVAKALVFTNKLWALLVHDLADPGNGLPKELRAQIVSIGIWIIRELESIRSGRSKSFADVITVSRAIRDGLL